MSERQAESSMAGLPVVAWSAAAPNGSNRHVGTAVPRMAWVLKSRIESYILGGRRSSRR